MHTQLAISVLLGSRRVPMGRIVFVCLLMKAAVHIFMNRVAPAGWIRLVARLMIVSRNRSVAALLRCGGHGYCTCLACLFVVPRLDSYRQPGRCTHG